MSSKVNPEYRGTTRAYVDGNLETVAWLFKNNQYPKEALIRKEIRKNVITALKDILTSGLPSRDGVTPLVLQEIANEAEKIDWNDLDQLNQFFRKMETELLNLRFNATED